MIPIPLFDNAPLTTLLLGIALGGGDVMQVAQALANKIDADE